tara:strand:+ start:91691 stop:91918 length:228 start_codon:yes stop_codon:yes gene_type:complete
MRSFLPEKIATRYRGFLFLKQHDKTWLIRLERSPMFLLPFRTKVCSIEEAKNILDMKLILKKDKYAKNIISIKND